MAYLQSVDVEAQKGQTHFVMEQQSTHANSELSIGTLERGLVYYVVGKVAKDRIVSLFANQAANDNSERTSLDNPPSFDNHKRITVLKDEFVQTVETSQVLLNHLSSLKAQLTSCTDTKRFLAT